MNVEFSVIIPVYNRPVKIKRAVESILQQTYDKFELIIVDDGSTDTTLSVIADYSDSRIRVISSENGGVSKARNRGIEESSFPYIALLDSDDQWLPGKLAEDNVFIENNPETQLFQSDEIWIRSGVRVNKKKYHSRHDINLFKESLKRCMISPSAVVFTRKCFERHGPFDEKMKVCEDYDLWLRMLRYEKCAFINKELIIKYGGDNDQLSRSVIAIDRYRLYSLYKLYADPLTPEYLRAEIKDMFNKKASILLQGAKKRENNELAERITALSDNLQTGAMLQDALFLLQE